MTPFLSKGGKTYKTKVRHGGKVVTLSTGQVTAEDAADVERMLDRFRGQQGRKHARPDVMALLAARRPGASLAAVYEAYLDGTLDDLVARVEAESSVTDLRPHLTPFEAWKRRQKRGAGSAHRYRRCLETLYPEGEPFTTATFTTREVDRRIGALDVSDPRKNVYRAAASAFGVYGVKHGLWERNPVDDAESYAGSDREPVYLERAQAKALIAALAQPWAAAAALMCAAGLEWQSIERLRASDVDLAAGTIYCRATKTRSRTRTVRILRENAWCLPYIRPALAGKVGDALVFPGAVRMRMLEKQKAALAARGLPHHTLHDWRHTHAVQALRDGYSEVIVAAQLGHKTTTEVRETYGRFVPTELDYVPRRHTADVATRATTPHPSHEREAAK